MRFFPIVAIELILAKSPLVFAMASGLSAVITVRLGEVAYYMHQVPEVFSIQ